ncbi:hypothetical protein H6P81_020878 [Aristolochia fimbriata]|uniref:Uncharacterized protein n=1 Tax=Aristolochia fimbriata TaxID=158543 RepID=A0AAV7DWM0_ARIFI|nr:hypothetical protein H6P81_020878 [Aristolochia fimbriata]
MSTEITQPSPTSINQQAYTSHSGFGSVGPLIAVLAVISILGVVAGMIGRLCAGRTIMGHGQYDFEGWIERKCSSCIDGRIDPPPPSSGGSVPIAVPVENPQETKQAEQSQSPQTIKNIPPAGEYGNGEKQDLNNPRPDVALYCALPSPVATLRQVVGEAEKPVLARRPVGTPLINNFCRENQTSGTFFLPSQYICIHAGLCRICTKYHPIGKISCSIPSPPKFSIHLKAHNLRTPLTRSLASSPDAVSESPPLPLFGCQRTGVGSFVVEGRDPRVETGMEIIDQGEEEKRRGSWKHLLCCSPGF